MTSIPQTMQALELQQDGPVPPTLHLVSLPVPHPPRGHVLVKIHASAIHPSDQMNARGGFAFTSFPRVPGRDFAGTIVSGPPDRIGQAVFGTSGFTHAFTIDGFQAEYAVIPENAIAAKPKGLSFVQAARAGVPFTTADLMLESARAKWSETVLVLGANGAVGKAAVVLARARGCNVLRGVRGSGGDVDTEGDPTLAGARRDGKGVDVVLDTVGQLPLLSASMSRLAKHGRLVTIAAPRSGNTRLELDILDLYRDNKSLSGCNSLSYSIEEQAMRLRGLSDMFEGDQYRAMTDEGWEEVKLKNGVAAYENAGKSRKKYIIVMA